MAEIVLVGDTPVWFEKTGCGPSLLHIHGSAFGHANFERMTPLLSGRFEVIDFDMPGYGESGPSQRPPGIASTADDVFDFVRALGYQRVHVHGTSFGALVGLHLAARHPEIIDRLVLSCFLARHDRAALTMLQTWKRAARDSGMAAVADLTAFAGFSRQFFEQPGFDALLESMRVAFRRSEPAAFVNATESFELLDFTPLASIIQARTLLLAGEEDNMTPVIPGGSGVGMKALSGLMRDCQLVVLDECGHYLVIEQPDAAAEHITRFLLA
jgi:pimeloyl-ACP methyl ester carboxylesterase